MLRVLLVLSLCFFSVFTRILYVAHLNSANVVTGATDVDYKGYGRIAIYGNSRATVNAYANLDNVTETGIAAFIYVGAYPGSEGVVVRDLNFRISFCQAFAQRFRIRKSLKEYLSRGQMYIQYTSDAHPKGVVRGNFFANSATFVSTALATNIKPKNMVPISNSSAAVAVSLWESSDYWSMEMEEWNWDSTMSLDEYDSWDNRTYMLMVTAVHSVPNPTGATFWGPATKKHNGAWLFNVSSTTVTQCMGNVIQEMVYIKRSIVPRMLKGKNYFTINSAEYPNGEIRAQLYPSVHTRQRSYVYAFSQVTLGSHSVMAGTLTGEPSSMKTLWNPWQTVQESVWRLTADSGAENQISFRYDLTEKRTFLVRDFYISIQCWASTWSDNTYELSIRFGESYLENNTVSSDWTTLGQWTPVKRSRPLSVALHIPSTHTWRFIGADGHVWLNWHSVKTEKDNWVQCSRFHLFSTQPR